MDLVDAAGYHLGGMRAAGASPHTLRVYAMVEQAFIDWLAAAGIPATLAALEPQNVRRFLVHWAETVTIHKGKERPHGPQSLLQYTKTLKTWAKYLEREGFYPRDPLRAVRSPRTPDAPVKPFSIQQIELMLALCASTHLPLRNKAILALMADTGLRLSEVCGLKVADLSLANAHRIGSVRVLGKGRKERFVYFGAKTSQVIARYLASDRERPGSRQPWLFLTERGGPITRAVVDYLIRTLANRAGVVGMRVSPHVVRHTWATEYLKANPGHLSQVQTMLGHANIEMTQKYARLAEQDLEGSYRSVLDELNLTRVVRPASPPPSKPRLLPSPSKQQEPRALPQAAPMRDVI
jgi:site-specific recombinase XerD